MSGNSRSIAAIFVENIGAFSKSKIIGLDQSLPSKIALFWLAGYKNPKTMVGFGVLVLCKSQQYYDFLYSAASSEPPVALPLL